MISGTVNDDSLKSSIAASALLHVGALLFLYFGLPHLLAPLPEHHVPVPFEIVEIADITNTRIKDQAEAPKPPEPPPQPPDAKPTPPPSAQSIPQPQEPDILALKPAQKPKPPEVTKPKNDDFSKLLRNLEIAKKPETQKTETKPESKQIAQASNSQAPALSDRLTISEEDLLRRQIQQCWNMPIGARDAQNLVVEVSIIVNPDRTVQSAEVVDKSRVATDSFFRAAAESALRAVRDPRCSPLALPADKYDQWKKIDFTFDPRDML
jgi:outer membrane biosynthesis protein TonB